MPNLPYISPETHSKIKSIPASEYTNTQLIFFKNIHDQEIVYNFNADIQKNVIKVIVQEDSVIFEIREEEFSFLSE